MPAFPCQRRSGREWRHRQRGFTLFESIIVIGLLTLVSLGLLAMQPQFFKAQNSGRDTFVGLELMKTCAERMLAVRRNTGFGSVTSTLCNGMGGGGAVTGWAANPTVTLRDATNTAITTCSSATCTATILIAKTVVPEASLAPITLQLSAY